MLKLRSILWNHLNLENPYPNERNKIVMNRNIVRNKVYILALFILLLNACTPATMSNINDTVGTSLRYVRVETYNQSMEMWRIAADWVPFLLFLGIMFAGIGAAFFFSMEGGSKALISSILVALVIATFASRASHTNIVDRALVEVPEAADDNSINGLKFKKQEVSYRYLELVNYLLIEMYPNENTDYSRDSEFVKICKGNLDGVTNCYPYEHVYYSHSTYTCVSRDDDGNCTQEREDKHYQHDPDVKFLIRYGASANLPDKYSTPETNLIVRAINPDQPVMVFSTWMLPPNYDQVWFSGRASWDHNPYKPEDVTPPSEWFFYKDLKTRGSSSDHRYSNPLLATANESFVGDPALIRRLEEAGMLLEPRELYSPTGGNVRTYFDFVYPLGSCMNNMPVDWKDFTAKAGIVNTYYGNTLHISNSFAFVCDQDLIDQGITLDGLVYSIKADLYNENKWQRMLGGETLYTIMQQNTVLVVCSVSSDMKIPPTGCRVMSGLPIGNEALKQAFLSGIPQELQNVSFTPQGFFGNPEIVTSADGSLSLIGTEGSPMYLWTIFGAKKPSMDENFGYLVDRIVLTPEQIQEVIDEGVAKQREVVNRLYTFPLVILGLEFLLVLLVFLEHARNS